MSLRLDVRVRRPAHILDVRLDAQPGDVVAIVGPNGSGKTTMLRAVAGLQPLAEGSVVLDDTTWEDSAVRVPVADRRVGMVFQDLLLFPHLSALENVAFGPRSRGAGRADARRAATDWLERVGIGELAARRPGQLSGGQAQRVAVARALASEPGVLLLDEPLSALDPEVAMSLRLELVRHLTAYSGVTLLVTHDAIDALMLANRVLVLDDGRIVQEGTPQDVARMPRTSHVARMVGLNVLSGRSAGVEVALPDGGTLITSQQYDGPVSVTFSPAAVTVDVEQTTGSARNQWHGRVVTATPHGLVVRLTLDVAGGLLADVTAESAGRLGLAPGREVWATVKATEVVVLPDSTPLSPAPS